MSKSFFTTKSQTMSTAEFGGRLVTLYTGAQGLRRGITCEAKEVGDDDSPSHGLYRVRCLARPLR